MNSLREKIKSKEPVIGTHVSLSDPSICEILGCLNFDYIWVDMEHTYIDCEQLYIHLNAARAVGASVIVRIPQNDFITLKRVMEMGVDGVVFPMIRTVAEAEKAIDGTFYPPRGSRGFGPRKPIKYGLGDVNEYIENGSLDMCRFIQIEHVEAVKCVENLAEVDGIDGFIFGPCDLAGSIGQLCHPYDEPTARLMKETIQKLKARNKYIGVSTGDFREETIRYFSGMGIHMISAGADTDYLLYGAQKALRNLTKAHKLQQA
ncbi:HpcH/HpaI aldolase family protein [Diplocloster modestus]|uniref:Aldolase n=1 Tax=Diplocloster modestus TaxID=2850322 RepID=A0ABS6K4T1_9FIRM|nr:aldolase/citrate lyase family protein [Diplocloster modestus]MBU9725502.1 aldolase [Diplocloster modestus]